MKSREHCHLITVGGALCCAWNSAVSYVLTRLLWWIQICNWSANVSASLVAQTTLTLSSNFCLICVLCCLGYTLLSSSPFFIFLQTCSASPSLALPCSHQLFPCSLLSPTHSPHLCFSATLNLYLILSSVYFLSKSLGVPFSSVGRGGIPCTEALSSLQQPWVWVLAWGTLLHVTPNNIFTKKASL